jgi:hypothetical protein
MALEKTRRRARKSHETPYEADSSGEELPDFDFTFPNKRILVFSHGKDEVFRLTEKCSYIRRSLLHVTRSLAEDHPFPACRQAQIGPQIRQPKMPLIFVC